MQAISRRGCLLARPPRLAPPWLLACANALIRKAGQAFCASIACYPGDHEGTKGIYYINVVDCVTQIQVVAAVAGISEAFLLPALLSILEYLPFTVQGFHSDNGSEYINGRVAKLLEKLLIEQTKLRAPQ